MKNIQLLVTVVRLEECNVGDYVGISASCDPRSKLYLSFNVNGDSKNLPRVPVGSLPERMTFVGLVEGAGQIVTVELRSPRMLGAGGDGLLNIGAASSAGAQDDSEVIAKGRLLVENFPSAKSSRQEEQLYPLKLWGNDKVVGILQMIVVAVNPEQHAAQQLKRSSGFVAQTLTFLARWGWLVNLALMAWFMAHKLKLLSPRSTTKAIGTDRLPIGKVVLRRGVSLAQGDYVAACVGYTERQCKPVHLVLHQNGNLALRSGPSPRSSEDDEGKEEGEETRTLWESGKQSRRPFQEFRATVNEEGDLVILRGKKVVWKLNDKEREQHEHLSSHLEILEKSMVM